MKNISIGDAELEIMKVIWKAKEKVTSLHIGKEVEVLFEEEKVGIYKGHTQNYIMIYCESKEKLDNKIKKIRCKNVKEDYIFAEM